MCALFDRFIYNNSLTFHLYNVDLLIAILVYLYAP